MLSTLLLAWMPSAVAGPCSLHRVAPADGHALEAGLPRNTLVVRAPTNSCETGVSVRVLAADPVYSAAPLPREGCVAEADLSTVSGWSWVTAAPWNTDDATVHPQPPGLLLDPLPDTIDCQATSLTFADRTIALDQLGPLRPIDPTTLASVLSVQAHAIQRFGPLGLTSIHWTDGGRVSLPWVHWETDEEVATTYTREALDTEDRQERAVRARGPADAYLYFKGADPIRSDIWGTPATIHALIDTLADWQAACRATRPDRPEVCAVQLGDISWYSARRPDPLGHRDHFAGTCVDVRLFRADGSRYEAYWNRPDDRPSFTESSGYDAVLTGLFIDHLLAREDVTRVLFNDPALTSATAARGHDDHLHVCFD